MDLSLAITTVNATFLLAILVLAAAVFLSVYAVSKGGDNAKHLFAIIGVMLGLFGAGGLGSLFANQAASEAAKKSAPEAAETAVQVTEENAEEENAEEENKGTGESSKKEGKKNTTP